MVEPAAWGDPSFSEHENTNVIVQQINKNKETLRFERANVEKFKVKLRVDRSR